MHHEEAIKEIREGRMIIRSMTKTENEGDRTIAAENAEAINSWPD